MKTTSLVYIAACAVLTALANLLLRHGLLKSGGLALGSGSWLGGWAATLLQPAFLAGVVLYGLAAVVWFYALSVTEVSTGYPLLVGLTFVLVNLGAVALFHESLNPPKLAGMAFILAGIFLVARGA
ncbi:MAG: SMR family transporter [Kiritimatiellia bacterium]